MGIDALTRTDNGTEVVPASTEDWAQWVSATRTRNFALNDPLLDWLDLYGEASGFLRDASMPGYDPRTDFTEFIFGQGRRFENSVISHLRASEDVLTIANGPEDVRDLARAEETFRAMLGRVPIIHQGVLRDADHQTYGAPDLLVRSDVLRRLFPDALSPDEAMISAPDLGGKSWHYRVVDIKFRVLGMLASGELANDAPAYKLQLFTYNHALGRLQGLQPPCSYVLGRGWKQGNDRRSNCMDRLASVSQNGNLAQKRPLADAFAEGIAWVRRVRSEGAGWQVIPSPSVPELYPNSSNNRDGPWHHAKKEIAEQLEDVTLLWFVRAPGREKAHAAGIYRWTDPACTPAVVGIIGQKQAQTLQALLDINRSLDGPVIRPAIIRASEDEWRAEPALEFYVDFETVSDLADDFTRIPEQGGHPLIFMIGCGHLENGAWCFQSFVADALTEDAEATIIDTWLGYLHAAQERLAPGVEARLIHWSAAETATFETAYNSAKTRHPEKQWPSPRWFDFWTRVVREEPVVVRGAMNFGLKSVAKAMHKHGLIETSWGDGPTDGLGAMVGAWWCQDDASSRGVTLKEVDLMQEIVRYNETDCRVMMEIVRYLRRAH